MTPKLEPDLDEIILEYLRSVDAGESPEPAQWLRRYSQFADQLAPFFAVERGIHRIAAPAHESIHHLAPSEAEFAALPTRFGRDHRYERQSWLGRGGMGDVIRVRDQIIDRPLAIKILQSRFRDQPRAAKRFLDEARITGGLEHPGVPSVHDLEHLPDGRPFLVMRLIEGATLAALLAQRGHPSHNLPRLLQIFEQVAQTIAYAHSRGVLHRDLKPQNIMTGAFGEVQVMDWGLSKRLGVLSSGPPLQSSSSALPLEATWSGDGDLTVHGAVIGTPAYLAPEQARGDSEKVDFRADVFGLGAILCEILTGQPPFAGDFPLEQSRQGELEPALGRLRQAACDPELIRLAVHCLDPNPAKRPLDGEAVARAVVEYHASVRERLRQSELTSARAAAKSAAQLKQRRNARYLGGIIAAVLLAGISTILVIKQQANIDLQNKNTELATAKLREERRFNLALEAIGLLHGELSQDIILKEKQFSGLRDKLLRSASRFYGRLAEQIDPSDGEAGQFALARAYGQLGGLYNAVDNKDEALATLLKANEILSLLASRSGSNDQIQLQFARSLHDLAWAQHKHGRPEYVETLQRAENLLSTRKFQEDGAKAQQLLLADIHFLRASAAVETNQEQATSEYEKARDLVDDLYEPHTTDREILARLGDIHLQLGVLAPDTVSTQRFMSQALRYCQARIQLEPHSTAARRDVAHAHMALAATNGAADRSLSQAIEHGTQAAEMSRLLTEEYPFVLEFHRVFALSHYYLGGHSLLLGQVADSRAHFQLSLDQYLLLNKSFPPSTSIRRSIARARMHLAFLDLISGNSKAALTQIDQSQQDFEEAFPEGVNEPLQRLYYAEILRRKALILQATGQIPEALAEIIQAKEHLSAHWREVKFYPKSRIELAACHAQLAGLLKASASPGSEAAAGELQQSLSLLGEMNHLYRPHSQVLLKDPAFDALEGNPAFEEYLAELRKVEAAAAQVKD